MNQSSQLYKLQKIDTELDQTTARLAELQQLLDANEILQQAEKKAELARSNLVKARRTLQECEEAVTAVRIKINTSESSLYGGKIRNPKELQDLQTEISALKRRLATLEDEQLEAMVSVEDAEKAQQHEIEELTRAKGIYSSQQASLLGEKSQLLKTEEKLKSFRGAALPSILPENLDLYERLRKQKRGVAVSGMDESTCTACGSSIRPAERQAARAPQSMAFCSSCGRILYAG
jgi:uncharacterized protein